MKLRRVFLAATIFLIGSFRVIDAAELTQEILKENLQGNPESFEEIEIGPGGKFVDFEIKLGKSVVTTKESFVFDGFRFTAPQTIEGDLVWYFNTPQSWGHWYILPSEGELDRPGFRSWSDADKIYQEFDRSEESNRLRVLQTLGGAYFEPGKDYLIWFREHEKMEGDKTLRIRLGFAKHPEKEDGKWDIENLEKALLLKPQGAVEQVKHLDSRGGRILLDSKFFKPGYAENRIDHLFFSKRHAVQMQSGFFITMQISIPPCKTDPLMADIRAAHGEPDFVQTSAERKKLGRSEDDEGERVTYFYDYFGFETDSADPDQHVVQVLSQADDFSKLRDPEIENSFGQVSMKNLTVFHQAGKEVGRLYFFREGGKKPVVIEAPPVGIYSRGDVDLEFLGDGKWVERRKFEEGKIAQVFRYQADRMEGKAEGFYPNGKPRFTGNYAKGVLHGEVIMFAEDGTEESRRKFVEGEELKE